MADDTAHIRFLPAGWRAQTDLALASAGQGFNPYLERRARQEALWALYMLSDDELAVLGLTREDIPAHVFRGLLGH